MEPKFKTLQTPESLIRIVLNIVLLVSVHLICFEFRISIFGFVLYFQSNDIVCGHWTVKPFESELAGGFDFEGFFDAAEQAL
jgi:hypothetical protein